MIKNFTSKNHLHFIFPSYSILILSFNCGKRIKRRRKNYREKKMLFEKHFMLLVQRALYFNSFFPFPSHIFTLKMLLVPFFKNCEWMYIKNVKVFLALKISWKLSFLRHHFSAYQNKNSETRKISNFFMYFYCFEIRIDGK